MARYVMTNRCAGKRSESEWRASRSSLDHAFGMLLNGKSRLIADRNPEDVRKRRLIVLESETGTIEAVRQKLGPDIILEPEILHTVLGHDRQLSTFGLRFGGGAPFAVTIAGEGKPLKGCLVYMDLTGPGATAITLGAVTNSLGVASFNFPPIFTPVRLLALPHGGFWDAFVEGPEDGMIINVLPLPEGPAGWWHASVGVQHCDPTSGSGIKVGVIDSGVGPHGFLSHVKSVGSIIDLELDANGGTDVRGHGSHVCGTIAARPGPNRKDFMGIAPGVDLFSARVLLDSRDATQEDISLALEYLAEVSQVDLVNISLGARPPSRVLLDSIDYALEIGTLCLAAAGNDGGQVNYPAAFPEVVAVSALGLVGCAPIGTTASRCKPAEHEKFGTGGRFLANFSCHGAQIDCCAPGVGIISTVPERHGVEFPYAAMDGTSMASPVACAALATILAGAPEYCSMPRDSSRSSMARRVLAMSCRDVGMDERFQGRGIPTI